MATVKISPSITRFRLIEGVSQVRLTLIMKMLVICQDYPSMGNPSVMAFAHNRNKNYLAAGNSVDVLSFAAPKPYSVEGVPVLTESEALSRLSTYDIWVVHMPNLRNCLRFILTNKKQLKRLVFIIHGHEFIDWQKCVPFEFDFRRSFGRAMLRGVGKIYDIIKLKVWATYFRSILGRNTQLIFVSDFIRSEAERAMGISFEAKNIPNRVIHNPVHELFLKRKYQLVEKVEADFVTIRPFDDAKYGVDIVVRLASNNPDYTFHVYGKGRYFEYVEAPRNLKVFNTFFKPSELPEILNRYRCALLPTRWDSQGVLMCEVAAFGMPLLVSDLPICRQMIGDYQNVEFFKNDRLDRGLKIPVPTKRDQSDRFSLDKTVHQELEVFSTLPAVTL